MPRKLLILRKAKRAYERQLYLLFYDYNHTITYANGEYNYKFCTIYQFDLIYCNEI